MGDQGADPSSSDLTHFRNMKKESGSDYVAAAKLRRQAAVQGLSLSTPDCQIAAATVEHHCHLLTADKDFIRLAQLVPLQFA